jgi:hypothetical protein
MDLKMETDPVPEILCFLVTESSGRWKESTNPLILNNYTI